MKRAGPWPRCDDQELRRDRLQKAVQRSRAFRRRRAAASAKLWHQVCWVAAALKRRSNPLHRTQTASLQVCFSHRCSHNRPHTQPGYLPPPGGGVRGPAPRRIEPAPPRAGWSQQVAIGMATERSASATRLMDSVSEGSPVPPERTEAAPPERVRAEAAAPPELAYSCSGGYS